MATYSENLAMIRRRLDTPSPQQPDNAVLFELLRDQVNHHIIQLQNGSAQWSVDEYTLVTNEGTGDYLITATNFGKPFLVYMESQSDIYFPRIEVPFAMLQNVDQLYQGPRQSFATAVDILTARAISFYQKPSGWYARVTPTPGGTVTLKVWYETVPSETVSLGDKYDLTPFNHLIRVQTAIAALPYCAWGNVRVDAPRSRDAEAWTRKTQALALALSKSEAQFLEQFETYLGTIMEAGVEPRSGYGDGYDNLWSNVGYFAPDQW